MLTTRQRNRHPDHISGHSPDHLPDRLPDHLPDRLPDRLPEPTPDRRLAVCAVPCHRRESTDDGHSSKRRVAGPGTREPGRVGRQDVGSGSVTEGYADRYDDRYTDRYAARQASGRRVCAALARCNVNDTATLETPNRVFCWSSSPFGRPIPPRRAAATRRPQMTTARRRDDVAVTRQRDDTATRRHDVLSDPVHTSSHWGRVVSTRCSRLLGDVFGKCGDQVSGNACIFFTFH